MSGTRLYIGRLHNSVRERDIERFFKGFGRIREIMLKNGYGFVEFDDRRDADDAVYELNGRDLCGERVHVERAKGMPRGTDLRRDRERGLRYDAPPRRPDRFAPPHRTEYRVIVENLSSRCSWQDLKDHFRQAGEVSYADANRDSRNEGVVEFESLSDLENCMRKLDGSELCGRKVKLINDYRPRNKKRSRTRSRSPRSKSRSRSRSRDRVSKRRASRSKSPRNNKDGGSPVTKESRKSRSPTPVKKLRSRSRSVSPPPHRSQSRSPVNDKPSEEAGNGRNEDSSHEIYASDKDE